MKEWIVLPVILHIHLESSACVSFSCTDVKCFFHYNMREKKRRYISLQINCKSSHFYFPHPAKLTITVHIEKVEAALWKRIQKKICSGKECWWIFKGSLCKISFLLLRRNVAPLLKSWGCKLRNRHRAADASSLQRWGAAADSCTQLQPAWKMSMYSQQVHECANARAICIHIDIYLKKYI